MWQRIIGLRRTIDCELKLSIYTIVLGEVEDRGGRISSLEVDKRQCVERPREEDNHVLQVLCVTKLNENFEKRKWNILLAVQTEPNQSISKGTSDATESTKTSKT